MRGMTELGMRQHKNYECKKWGEILPEKKEKKGSPAALLIY